MRPTVEEVVRGMLEALSPDLVAGEDGARIVAIRQIDLERVLTDLVRERRRFEDDVRALDTANKGIAGLLQTQIDELTESNSKRAQMHFLLREFQTRIAEAVGDLRGGVTVTFGGSTQVLAPGTTVDIQAVVTEAGA
jgi:hypothetical protein